MSDGRLAVMGSSVLVKSLILFDIDGTLLRTGDRAHQQALIDSVRVVYGIDADLDGVSLGGMLDSQIVRLALEKYDVPPSDVRSGLGAVMEHMGTRYLELLNGDDRRSWLLPGVEELVEQLEDEFILSVLTGNASSVARAKLIAAGIDRFFSIGAYGDSADHRHELVPVVVKKVEKTLGVLPQPGDVLIVGDTPRDIEAARASSTRVLAVATGRHGIDELADYEPDLLFPDLGEVERVYQAIREMVRG
jgi:phosphoglycolate phosphatase